MQISYSDKEVVAAGQKDYLPGQLWPRTVQSTEPLKIAPAFNIYFNGLKNWMDAHPGALPGEYGFDTKIAQMYQQWIDDSFAGKHNYREDDIARLRELLSSVSQLGVDFSRRLGELQEWLSQNNNERPHRTLDASRQERRLAKWIYDTLGERRRYRYNYAELELLRKTVQSADNSVGERVFARNLEALKQWQVEKNKRIPHLTGYASNLELGLARWVHKVLFNVVPYYYTDEQRRILKNVLDARPSAKISA